MYCKYVESYNEQQYSLYRYCMNVKKRIWSKIALIVNDYLELLIEHFKPKHAKYEASLNMDFRGNNEQIASAHLYIFVSWHFLIFDLFALLYLTFLRLLHRLIILRHHIRLGETTAGQHPV